MNKPIRLATRQSPLALWQANYVKQALLSLAPALTIELIPLSTEGDRDTSGPLSDKGGKGLFVKELQLALLESRADIAVHSVKDMSVIPTPGLILAAIPKRADPRDAFVSLHYDRLNDLPSGANVGTSSPRRTAQLKAFRPDLTISHLRGNVQTRLKKLADGFYDAIILASAGLERLALGENIREYLNVNDFIPAIGQAALGIECRETDRTLIALLAKLNDPASFLCVCTERALNQRLGGNCYTPIAAHATLSHNQLHLEAMVGSLDGKALIKAKLSDAADQSERLALKLAEQLLNEGAKAILDQFQKDF